jgi:phage-related protein
LWAALQKAWHVIVAAVKPALDGLVQTIETQVVPALGAFVTAILPIITWLVEHLAPIVASIFAGIVEVIDGAMKIISGIINVISGLITGDWGRVWDGIKQIVSGAWEAIKGLVQVALGEIQASSRSSVAPCPQCGIGSGAASSTLPPQHGRRSPKRSALPSAS